MTLRAVVFDLDGTLVHSAPDIHAAAVALLAELGRPALTLGQVTGFIGNGVAKLVERCLAATGGSDPALHARALHRYEAIYARAPAALTRPWPGVVETLGALRDAGLALGVCTNKPQGPAERVLAALGLDPFFAAVVGGGAAPAVKPDPAPLRLCLDRLGAAPAEAALVGDSEIDAETARAAGVAFAFFTEGYRRGPAEATPAALRFADFAALAPWALAAR